MSETNPFRANKLFQGVPRELLDQFHHMPQVMEFAPEEIVFREGDPADFVFLIESGTVRISMEGREGRQETVSFMEANDFFGELGLYDRTVRSARATAVGPVAAGCLGLETFEELLRVAPTEIVANLLRENVGRLRQTDARYIRKIIEAERLSLIGSMLSTVVHDIRQPLTAIRGAAELLSSDLDSARRNRYAAMQQRLVDRITEMTRELLDYAEGNTSLAVKPVSPQQLMAEFAEEVLQPLEGSNVLVLYTVTHRGIVNLDRSRFFRVLQNLVKNSVEAMPDGGTLTITVEESEGNAVFRIADSGVGIPAHILPTIFEPFVTYDKSGGTGLGMAIVKSVVDAHGGRIQVESSPGVGTTFTIWIPNDGVGQ